MNEYFEQLEEAYGSMPVEVEKNIAKQIENANDVLNAFRIIREHYMQVAKITNNKAKYG